jgi:hypothetical protein
MFVVFFAKKGKHSKKIREMRYRKKGFFLVSRPSALA